MPTAPAKDDPRTVFGWCMYDWANSAYITTAVGLLPIFFASTIVPKGGAVLFGNTYRADTLWGFTVGLAGIISFIIAPILGSIADFSAAKKKFLLGFAYTGSLFCMMLYFVHSGDVILTLAIFLVSQLGFVNANIFYDAFLPHVSSDAQMDRTSAKGYAYGYIGGGLQFAVALALVSLNDRFGLAKEHAARIGIAMAGLWWLVFTIYSMRFIHEAAPMEPLPDKYRGNSAWLAYLRVGLTRTWSTTVRAARFKHLVLFLLAFMMYNEGIQTVINMATTYGTVELKLPASALMLTLLIIQFVAFPGSLLFSWFAGKIGTRRSIILALLIWCGVVVYAYFMTTTTQFFALGVIVGVAMGGSQSLSRSYYGSMIPAEASAEFFGFYTVFSKFSAIWGPWVFALITHFAQSARTAIVSLVVFFVIGVILLSLVDEQQARSAKLEGAF
ncbi:MAG TPA: MFS transporter [Terriglobales bacterium]|nr:MFS transporter [Terriglobales bacterium]